MPTNRGERKAGVGHANSRASLDGRRCEVGRSSRAKGGRDEVMAISLGHDRHEQLARRHQPRIDSDAIDRGLPPEYLATGGLRYLSGGEFHDRRP